MGLMVGSIVPMRNHFRASFTNLLIFVKLSRLLQLLEGLACHVDIDIDHRVRDIP
jgi:hypothetical protein